MKRYSPTAALRGDRPYVHSTDLYQDIIGGAETLYRDTCAGPVSINFRAVFNRVPVIVYADGADLRPAHAVVDFELAMQGLSLNGWVELGETIVTVRKPYDENPIRRAVAFDGGSASVNVDTGARPIEVMTVLGVALLNRSRPPESGKKWLLGRLQLQRPLAVADAGAMTVRLGRSGLPSVCRLDVACSGDRIGQMVFALGDAYPLG